MTKEQFNQIVLRYQEPVISIIYKMVFSWETARDIAQESFLKLWNMKNKIRTNNPIFTLLYRIAMNLAIDNLRKNRNMIFEDYSERNHYLDSQSDTQDLNTIIADCCKKLNPRQRAVFNLRDIEGLSFEEIAEILETNIGNVRSNLHIARKKMREILFQEYQINEAYFYEL